VSRPAAIPVTVPLLEGRGISKAFGHVQALVDVGIELFEGEILGLVGDNGAGKSTLIKIVSGALAADAGEIRIDGEPVHIRTPAEARQHGIETVYQELAVVPLLDVAENLYLGRELRLPGPPGRILHLVNKPAMRRNAATQLRSLNIGIKSVRQRVETLSGGQRQGVAVARSVVFGRRIVILDEPTAALGVKEAQTVVELIETISARGLSVVLISHNMPQVLELTHRIMVLRAGRRVGVVRTAETSMEQIVRLITGAEVLHAT
jgi:fructose transport system ATP-binding protein